MIKKCEWCGDKFDHRVSDFSIRHSWIGNAAMGKEKVFCSNRCKHEYEMSISSLAPQPITLKEKNYHYNNEEDIEKIEQPKMYLGCFLIAIIAVVIACIIGIQTTT